jgi:hypothetical protein
MGDHSAFYEFLKVVGPFLIVLGGFVLSVIIVTKYKVPRLESDVVEMKGRLDGLEKGQGSMATKEELLKTFTDPSGNPRFQPVARCQEIREFCGRQNNILIQHLGDKMDSVGDRMVEALNEIDKKRTEQQQDNSKKFDELADAIERTNNSLEKTNEKLSGVVQEVKVITANGTNGKSDIEKIAETLAKKIAKEIKSAA